MKQLKNIKQNLVDQVQAQLKDTKTVNTKELGEVIDMIKDLEEAMYYCAIITAMEEKNSKSEDDMESKKYYVPYMEYAPYMMRDEGWRDRYIYDGRSGNSRRMYMEGKQYHMGDEQQSMKELEHYMKDLSDDLIEMVKESTPEEKQVLSTKLQTLATKINK